MTQSASTPEAVNSETLLTSHQAGSLLQVNPSSINNWVREGRLHAFRTPGGHRRIRAQDLVNFLSQHSMPIPASLQGAARRRLLVVEGQESRREELKRAFHPLQDRVDLVCVSSLMEGMLQVGLFRPHLLVLDGDLSDVNGDDVRQRLAGMPETSEVVVKVTSHQATTDLQKPLQPTELLTLLGMV